MQLNHLYFCFIITLPYVTLENTTLELLHILFRHGERSPSKSYKNDPHKDYEWPGGWNQLTYNGKREMYNLGVSFRNQYNDFLSQYYLPEDVYVLSSYAERCHESAQLLLAGLFPPYKEQVWTRELLWQPIPVNDLPRNLDNIIAMRQECPSYDKAFKDVYKSEKYIKINEDNAELFEYLSANTGENITTILRVESLYNSLQIEEVNNLTLPEWTERVYPDKLKELASISLASFVENEFMQRMKGGAFLKKVLSNMKNKQVGTSISPNRKLFLYSGHDITIVNIMRTLGVSGILKPYFGASLIFELHKIDNRYIVKLFYRNDILDGGTALKINMCEEECSFEDFIRLLDPVIPKNWEEECKLS